MDIYWDVIVIGGGASGLMAAGRAASAGAKVLLLEKNEEVGKKILVTGKGRCNVTNDCDKEEFQRNMPGNGRFLYSAFSQFDSEKVQKFFLDLGVKLKTERGRRVFPQSDRAEDIRSALLEYVRAHGARIATNKTVSSVHSDENGRWVVEAAHDRYMGKSVVIATGGASYPTTGSTGDGYRMARALGHRVFDPIPSLVPLETVEDWVRDLQGLTLKNASVQVWNSHGVLLGEEFGELLFTHFGVSGPVILTVSRAVARALADNQGPIKLTINLKPAISRDELDNRLQREFADQVRRQFKNSLKNLLPRLLIPVVIRLSGIDPETPVHQISREQRLDLGNLLQQMTLTVVRTRPLAEAVITMGGVEIKEVQPKTMASRLKLGLYFCGEVLDIDGYTGGYNLQAAFSTGVAAGQAAAVYALGCQTPGDGI